MHKFQLLSHHVCSFVGFLAGVSTACGVGYINLNDDVSRSFVEVQNALTILRKDINNVRRANQLAHTHSLARSLTHSITYFQTLILTNIFAYGVVLPIFTTHSRFSFLLTSRLFCAQVSTLSVRLDSLEKEVLALREQAARREEIHKLQRDLETEKVCMSVDIYLYAYSI